MSDLVFLDPDKIDAVPFTTSDVIAEYAEVKHHAITRLIQQHEPDFREFGILRFEIEEISGRGQPKKSYRLNEEQATLLMTYLKNTEQVREFKKNLVRQFYAMRAELQKRQMLRIQLKPEGSPVGREGRERGQKQVISSTEKRKSEGNPLPGPLPLVAFISDLYHRAGSLSQ